VSQKRITPRSGNTSETPTKCHSWLSPASRASCICSLMFLLWSSISSWAKNRPWSCSVTSRPSISQPPEVSCPVFFTHRLVALPRTRTRPTTKAPVPREALRLIPSPQTSGMWSADHHCPGLVRRFQSRTRAAIPNPHASRSTMAIASSSWLTIGPPLPSGYERSIPLTADGKNRVKVRLSNCKDKSIYSVA
jgi:hypothetical protein